MISQIKALLPGAAEPLALKMWYAMRPLIRVFFSGHNRYCVLCDCWSRRFLAHGFSSRKMQDAICPICLSHGRHRLAWLYFRKYITGLGPSPKKFLHIAPEVALAIRFRKLKELDYLSADLASPHAMIHFDITTTGWADDSFDLIYCSHVLEHVREDRAAIRELFRILKSGGIAVLQTPVWRNATIEDPSITDPVERERLFWWNDHVRLYGMDITERLTEAGFAVEVTFGHELLDPQDCERMSINPNEPIFRCTKPV